jgi:hypothetical protein
LSRPFRSIRRLARRRLARLSPHEYALREGRCDRACRLWNEANRDSEWRARRASDFGATFLILQRHRADLHRAQQIE